jgi:hypothetical protein
MSTTIERAAELARRFDDGTFDRARPGVYRLAGVASGLAALFTVVAVAAFAIWPPPYDEPAAEWFELFQDNALLGLVSLDLPFLLVSMLMIPVMLGIYLSLRNVRPGYMLVGAALYLVSVAAYVGTNTSVEMLGLSQRYAEAATETQRMALLGAGEAALATFDGTAFHINYILGQIAGIMFGLVMLRSHVFSNRIAYLMIAGNAIGFALYLPAIGLTVSALSGLVLWVWMILISRRFLKLAREEV